MNNYWRKDMWFPVAEAEHSSPKRARYVSSRQQRQQQRQDSAHFTPRPASARPGQRQPAPVGAFIPGVPDVNAFPHPLFSKIQARISRRPKPEQLSYSCNGGTPELQQALVDYLRVARGVHCQADQILITEGIHQAIDLVTRMLCDSGDLAWVEEPSYWGIRHVLAMNDVRAEPDRRCQRPVPAGNG
jgi:DNA-binding transcriptional MocR family regulator